MGIVVQNPEVMLCRGKTLFSRLAQPKGRLRVVSFHTPALVAGKPQVELRLGVTLLSRLAPPKRRLRVVLRHTLAVAVQHAKLELRCGEALLCGPVSSPTTPTPEKQCGSRPKFLLLSSAPASTKEIWLRAKGEKLSFRFRPCGSTGDQNVWHTATIAMQPSPYHCQPQSGRDSVGETVEDAPLRWRPFPAQLLHRQALPWHQYPLALVERVQFSILA